MRVRDKDGRLVTKDHPHEIINPKVMRFDEIRAWLKELSENDEYGWADGGNAALCRSLGYSSRRAIYNKLYEGRWIWPKEQVRLTARINDILEGRIVPRKMRRPGLAGRPRIEGVHVFPPQPPVVAKPRVVHCAFNGARLSLQSSVPKRQQTMPQFGLAFKEVQVWDPNGELKKTGPIKAPAIGSLTKGPRS